MGPEVYILSSQSLMEGQLRLFSFGVILDNMKKMRNVWRKKHLNNLLACTGTQLLSTN